MGILNSIFSLGSKVNKAKGQDNDETAQGAGEQLPELALDMSDKDLIALTKDWEKSWNDSEIKGKWEEMSKANEDYWLGKQFDGAYTQENRPLVDNLIFESLETFLPQATRRNPEPVIQVRGKEQNSVLTDFAKSIQLDAAEWADEIKLRLKIKRVARHWGIYLIGVAEMGWNLSSDRPQLTTIRPKKLILDPESYIDEDGYHGRFAGIRQQSEASVLVKKFPKKKADITTFVDGKMGTNVKYIKWVTAEYTCFTLGNLILDKYKNPHWNYDKEEPQAPAVDEFGNETPQPPLTVPGQNHFAEPRIPLIFLTVFNLGKQPVDETNLIQQNLPQQDLINKRLRQIDKFVNKANGGQVVSGEKTGLTQEQATLATEALDNGGTVYIPQGSAAEGFHKLEQPSLPGEVFNQLVDQRTRLLQIFGTQGISSQGIGQEKTVRGKILTKGQDSDRIGGGVTEYLEQFADDVFNWYVQLLYVYKPDLFTGFATKLKVSVKEGSLLPKDDVSQAQQAIDLAVAGKMSLLDLYKRLDDPNPEQTAANVWLEVNAPHLLYQDNPLVQQAVGMMQAQAQAQQQQQMQQEQMQQQADQQHQGQMQQAQMQGQMQMKQMDNEAKMQQLQKKQEGDLLKQVPVQ